MHCTAFVEAETMVTSLMCPAKDEAIDDTDNRKVQMRTTMYSMCSNVHMCKAVLAHVALATQWH